MRIHAISDSRTIKKNNIDDSGVGEFIFHGSAPPHMRKFPPLLFFLSTIQLEKHFKHSGEAHRSMNKISSNDEWSYELPAVTVIGIYGGSFSAAFADNVRHCANEFWFEFCQKTLLSSNKTNGAKKIVCRSIFRLRVNLSTFLSLIYFRVYARVSAMALLFSISLLTQAKVCSIAQRLRSDEKDVILHGPKV